MLRDNFHQEMADKIWQCSKDAVSIEAFSKNYPEMTLSDSRKIQMINIARRLDEGHRMVGKKVGATNKVMQELLNLQEPVMGYLLSDIIKNQRETIVRASQINPFIECEIGFVMSEPLSGPNAQPYDVLSRVAGTIATIEVPDVRIHGDVQILDALADNVYNGYLVVGDVLTDVRGLDFSNIPITLYKNGEAVCYSGSAAAMGSPVYVVAWLANKLYEYGERIEKGDIVITGSLNPAFYIEAGDTFMGDFGPLGRVQAKFV